MPGYRWPVKVARYGITCPFQRLLVAKYESVIDWSGDRIQSPESLNRHLRAVMLPKLKRRLHSTGQESHYCRSINLDQLLTHPAPHIEEARRLRMTLGATAARKFLLAHINGQKKAAFTAWWSYLTKGNHAYVTTPAFQYLLLRPVVESSDAKCTRPPLPVDAEALARLFERIQDEKIAPTQGLLAELCRLIAPAAEAAPRQSRSAPSSTWVVIDRKTHNAAARVAALSQGSGWCVASASMAASYLERSDFHLLVDRGKPVAALRLKGREAVEVQGQRNGDPGPWWAPILLYCASRGVRLSQSYEAAAPTQKLKSDLAALRDRLPVLNERLRQQPALVAFLSPEMANAEEARGAIESAWRACAETDPVSVSLAPAWIAGDPELKARAIGWWVEQIVRNPHLYDLCLPAVKADPLFHSALVPVWRDRVIADPRSFKDCPPEFRSDPQVHSALVSVWLERLLANLRSFKDCPPEVRAHPQVRAALVPVWLERLRADPRLFYDCPCEIRSDPQIRSAMESVWLRRLAADPKSSAHCPPEIFDALRVQSTWKTAWRRLLDTDPGCALELPYDLREDPEVYPVWKGACRRRLESAAISPLDCPVELRNEPAIQAALAMGWAKELESRPESAWFCPAALRAAPRIHPLWKAGWRQLLESNPKSHWFCPPELRRDPAIRAALIRGWDILLASDPASIADCPADLRGATT